MGMFVKMCVRCLKKSRALFALGMLSIVATCRANDVPINVTDHIIVWIKPTCSVNISDCAEPQLKGSDRGFLNCSEYVTEVLSGRVLSYMWMCRSVESHPVFVDLDGRAVVIALNVSIRMRDPLMEWVMPRNIRQELDTSDHLTAVGSMDESDEDDTSGITSGCQFESGLSLPRLFGMDYVDATGDVVYRFRLVNLYASVSEAVHMTAYIYVTYPDNSTGLSAMDLRIHEDYNSNDGSYRSRATLFAYTSGSTLKRGSCIVEAVGSGKIDRLVAHTVNAPFLENGRSQAFLIICIAGICSSACLVIWVVSYVSWRYVSTRRKSIDDTTRMKTDEQPPDVVIGDAPWYPAAFDNKGATLDMEEIEIRSDETS
ncbi:gp5 [Caviid betaherpesvirus 2]|uniref:Gp5 n=1 Tax=Guinea pig cytomegalovirus (strain 22122) TaxID=103920 RepID=B7TPT6_GPCMV|nr:gp5 [Caviid betaherpesvirus 2]AGE11498.1 gp5 [Caviid betaherpesvirus 2]AIL83886.1 gp5 [BAC cloning vector GPN13BACdenovo_preserved(MM)]BAJ78488.1 gp5 [Caviid betaherpesvirus 2]